MKAVVFCEGTTDLLMIQFVLQYKYGWKYDGFVENTVSNRLMKRILVKDGAKIEIRSCGGITNIPDEMRRFQEQMEYSTKKEELFDKVIILIDHDTVDSNKIFVDKLNEKLQTNFNERDINVDIKWKTDNLVFKEIELDFYISCLPEEETGAIESVMLEALVTDDIEENLVNNSEKFILYIRENQDRYLQRKSLIAKAVFNTYFAISTPEEKCGERSRVLRAYDWKNNEVLNKSFGFLDIYDNDNK